MTQSQDSVAVAADGGLQELLDQVTVELLKAYEHLASIFDSAAALSAVRHIDEVARSVLGSCVEVTESAGGVFLLAAGSEDYMPRSAINASADIVEYARRKAAARLQHGRYEDRVQQRLAAADGRFVVSSLHQPALVREGLEGCVFLFSTGGKRYSSVDLKIVRVLAGQGCLAVGNLVALSELEEKNRRLSQALCDLTDAQKELVRRERFSALGKTASMIVHDIKNPMGSLLGYAQLLHHTADTIKPDDIREYSSLIIQEMRRLSNMTEEIMEFARGVDSKLHLRLMESNDLINTALRLLKKDLESHSMTLVRGPIQDAAHIAVDSDKMERVLINLAVNARQAMDPGGTLTYEVLADGQWVEFRFKDTGKGIPDPIREVLFEPFVTTKKGQGLGIGLAMSRWIVQAHGGDIRVAETGPGGTSMVVRLPAAS